MRGARVATRRRAVRRRRIAFLQLVRRRPLPLLLGIRPAYYAQLATDLLERCRRNAELLGSIMLRKIEEARNGFCRKDERRCPSPSLLRLLECSTLLLAARKEPDGARGMRHCCGDWGMLLQVPRAELNQCLRPSPWRIVALDVFRNMDRWGPREICVFRERPSLPSSRHFVYFNGHGTSQDSSSFFTSFPPSPSSWLDVFRLQISRVPPPI